MTSPVLKSGSQLSCSFEVDVSRLRFELVAVDPVIMPPDNKCNVLRGALMDIVNWLARTKVVQLLEFAKTLAASRTAWSPNPLSTRFSERVEITRMP